MSSSSKKSERQNDHFWARVCNLLLVDIHGSLLGTATYANDCIISILNLDMPSCMHCQSIVCQNSIARILHAKIPLLEFHMPIVLYAEIPIAKIQESRSVHYQALDLLCSNQGWLNKREFWNFSASRTICWLIEAASIEF